MIAASDSGLTATLLEDGRVLVLGSRANGEQVAELYDPDSGSWSATATLAKARKYHTATLLLDGTVLVAGGAGSLTYEALLSARLYDPEIGSWSVTGTLSEARWGHAASLLLDGRVLLAGGLDSDGERLATAELYDPVSRSWTATGNMHGSRRGGYTATVLPDGRVLVAGGSDDKGVSLASAEIYDPGTGTWTATGTMAAVRSGHTATLLLDGKVMVAGGYVDNPEGIGAPRREAELYDPGTGNWTATGEMLGSRGGHVATLLSDGSVLVSGGCGFGEDAPAFAPPELYDPVRGSWSATPTGFAVRCGHTSTLLRDGSVLVAGGEGSGGLAGGLALASAELYHPGG